MFCPVITEGMTYYLKHLIVEHHSLFKELYPHKNLIPKHHYMLHYPRCIRMIGPLVHVWSMRCEAKHKFFKNSIKNFKNITKSLALKHQYAIAFHWERLPVTNVEYGPLKTLDVEELPYFDTILERYPNYSDSKITVASWLRHSGTEYRHDLLVCTEMEKDLPVFSKITEIVLIDDQNVLVTKDWDYWFCRASSCLPYKRTEYFWSVKSRGSSFCQTIWFTSIIWFWRTIFVYCSSALFCAWRSLINFWCCKAHKLKQLFPWMYLQTQSIELILDCFLLLLGMFSVRKRVKNVSLRKPSLCGLQTFEPSHCFYIWYCYTLFLFVWTAEFMKFYDVNNIS